MQGAQELATLAVDIGGSGIKAMVLDAQGTPQTERQRTKTPQPSTPEVVIAAIAQLTTETPDFDRVSVGFPGVIKQGVVFTAVNLSPDWIGCDLATALGDRLGKLVRVANDADIQGLGAIVGQGVELVITLGTGFGSALFVDGHLVPNLELGHHPFRDGKTYEQLLGRAALDQSGKKKWNQRLAKAIATLEHLFNYNSLHIGGGNTKHITFDLPENAKIVPNLEGLLGGIALWQERHPAAKP